MEEEKKEKIEVKEHSDYVSILWTLLAFLFPMTEYIFRVMWKEKGLHETTEKRTKLASIIGSAVQVVFILVTSIYGLIKGTTFISISLRAFLFYTFLLYALESAAILILPMNIL